MSISPGRKFGSYEVVESIDAGGMGEVYRAVDRDLKREVALKVLPAAFVADTDRLMRFQREAEMLAALNHPNIAQVYGLEKSDGQTAIVMELVDGATLATRIKAGPIPPDEAMGIALQVIAALEAAHAKHIVHRDLKPANVKLKADGTVKVLDFGISKPIDPQAISGASPVMTTPAVTQTGVILGTAAYMSPEQARGKFVDERTDVWAFGCLLFEMLTGQPAFGGEDVMLTLARVLDRDADLKSIPQTLSPAVRHTLKLCLQKDPRKRIADIRDVRLALEGTFESELPQTVSAQAAMPLWQRAWPAAAAALVAAALATLASLQLTAPEPPAVRRSVQVIPPELRANQPTIPALAISPDGSRIAYAVGGALYQRSLSELEGRMIPGTDGERPVVPVYSPDGQWLLYGSLADGQLKRVAVDGGTPLPVVPDSPSGGWRWPEQATIYFAEGCEMFSIAPTGGEPKLLAEEPGFNCFEPERLPGTDYLLYERRPQQGGEQEIVAHSTTSGEVTPLLPGHVPMFVAPYLFYFDSTLGLMARRLDPKTLTLGSPVGVLDEALAIGSNIQARVAASGSLVYVEGEATQTAGGTPLSLANDTGLIRQLSAPPNAYAFPSVSPNGDWVAVQIAGESATNIFVYELSGRSEIRQLTFAGNNRLPAWSHDGEWVYFASDRDGRTRIWRKRANGRGDDEPVTEPAEGHAHELPAITADGDRLAYTDTDASGDGDIWIMSLPDGEPELLVGGANRQIGIAFSPDGQAMAYASNATGAFTLFVEPYPKEGGSGTRISADGEETVWPVWSRDSAHLSYQLLGGGGFGRIDIDTSNFAISGRRSLEIAGNPGQRRAASMPPSEELLVTVAAGAGGGEVGQAIRLIVVEHWIEEVKARVPEIER